MSGAVRIFCGPSSRFGTSFAVLRGVRFPNKKSDNPMPVDVAPIGRALISVSDKSGLETLARALAERGVEIVSTGGTAAALAKAGFEVVDVAR